MNAVGTLAILSLAVCVIAVIGMEYFRIRLQDTAKHTAATALGIYLVFLFLGAPIWTLWGLPMILVMFIVITQRKPRRDHNYWNRG
jgi:hypothetical protein